MVAFLRSYGNLYAMAAVFGMYTAVAAVARTPVPPVVQLVFSCGIATGVAMWVCLDARSRQRTPCFDFGTFVFFTWYISVPVYLVATRGWRGLFIALTTFITVLLAAIATTAIAILLAVIAA